VKGIVFTEFMEMVEQTFSAEVLDDVIDKADLPNSGAYTAVGTYDHAELVRMVLALSEHVNIPPARLIRDFGRHLFGRFFHIYPSFFQHVDDVLTFLNGIETIIHTEVRKLYPEAQLPSFDCQLTDTGIDMVYHSPRHFEELAHGLIEGAVAHFKVPYEIERMYLAEEKVLFRLTSCSPKVRSA
jgi:Haem-NO-binding